MSLLRQLKSLFPYVIVALVSWRKMIVRQQVGQPEFIVLHILSDCDFAFQFFALAASPVVGAFRLIRLQEVVLLVDQGQVAFCVHQKLYR